MFSNDPFNLFGWRRWGPLEPAPIDIRGTKHEYCTRVREAQSQEKKQNKQNNFYKRRMRLFFLPSLWPTFVRHLFFCVLSLHSPFSLLRFLCSPCSFSLSLSLFQTKSKKQKYKFVNKLHKFFHLDNFACFACFLEFSQVIRSLIGGEVHTTYQKRNSIFFFSFFFYFYLFLFLNKLFFYFFYFLLTFSSSRPFPVLRCSFTPLSPKRIFLSSTI